MDPVLDWLTCKDPAEETPNVGSAVHAWHGRELGIDPKNTLPNKKVLENYAEDTLLQKPLKIRRCELPGYPRSTFLMVFSPDGTKVASTHGNHNVYVSELASGKHVRILKGHPRTPWCIAFHPSHTQLIGSGCLGGEVRVWDITSGGSEVWNVQSETVIASIAFHPRDQLLVIATYNELYFWDWSQPAPYMRVSTNSINEKVRYVAFDALGYKLITGISLWAPAAIPIGGNTSTLLQQNPNLSQMPAYRRDVEDRTTQNDLIVNSYQNLVQRYDSLVRNYQRLFMVRHRLTNTTPPPTIDRGTDPMETDVSPGSSFWTRNRPPPPTDDATPGPSTSRGQDGANDADTDGDSSNSRLLNFDVLSIDGNPTDRNPDPPFGSRSSAFQPLSEGRTFRTVDQSERSTRLLPNPFSASGSGSGRTRNTSDSAENSANTSRTSIFTSFRSETTLGRALLEHRRNASRAQNITRTVNTSAASENSPFARVSRAEVGTQSQSTGTPRPTMTNSSTQISPSSTSVDAQTINESLDLIRDILRDSGTRLLNLITNMSSTLTNVERSLRGGGGRTQSDDSEGGGRTRGTRPRMFLLSPRRLRQDLLSSTDSDDSSDQSLEINILRARNYPFSPVRIDPNGRMTFEMATANTVPTSLQVTVENQSRRVQVREPNTSNNEELATSSRNEETGTSSRNEDTGSSSRNKDTGTSSRNNETGTSSRNEETDMSSINGEPGTSSRNKETGTSSRNGESGTSSNNKETGMLSRNVETEKSSRNKETEMSSINGEPGTSSRNNKSGTSSRNGESETSSNNKETGMLSRNVETETSSRNRDPGTSSRNNEPGTSSRNKELGMSSRNKQPGTSSSSNQSHGINILRTRKCTFENDAAAAYPIQTTAPLQIDPNGRMTFEPLTGNSVHTPVSLQVTVENQSRRVQLKVPNNSNNEEPGTSYRNEEPGTSSRNKEPGTSSQTKEAGQSSRKQPYTSKNEEAGPSSRNEKPATSVENEESETREDTVQRENASPRPSTSRENFWDGGTIPPAEAFKKVSTGVIALQKHTILLADLWIRGNRPTMRELRTMWENLRRRILALHRQTGRQDLPSHYTRSLLERCMMLTDMGDHLPRATPIRPSRNRGDLNYRNSDRNAADHRDATTTTEPANADNDAERNENASAENTSDSRPSTSGRSSQPRGAGVGRRSSPNLRRILRSTRLWRAQEEHRRRLRNPSTIRLTEISATRHEIRMRAMQVLSVMFNMMMMCLEERGLSHLIITMLKSLKKALAMTCLMLMMMRNAANRPVNPAPSTSQRVDSLSVVRIQNDEHSGPVNVDGPDDPAPTPAPTAEASAETNEPENQPARKKLKTEKVEKQSQSTSTDCPEIAPSTSSRSQSPPQKWSNRVAVQIAAANRNNSVTARDRRELYLESRRLKALHKTNPGAHPIAKKRALPPVSTYRIPALRSLPNRLKRLSTPRNQPRSDEPVAGPSNQVETDDEEPPRDEMLNEFQHRVNLIRLAHLQAVRLRNAARTRFRRLQTIRMYSTSSVREMFAPQNNNDNIIYEPASPPHSPPAQSQESGNSGNQRGFSNFAIVHPHLLIPRSEAGNRPNEEPGNFHAVLNNVAMPLMQVNELPANAEGSGIQPNRLPRIHEYLQPIILAQNAMVVDDENNGDNGGGGNGGGGNGGGGNGGGGNGGGGNVGPNVRRGTPGMERMERFLDSGLIPEALPAPIHRVQAWDFTAGQTPEISNSTKNVVVQRCRIHNDASIDISKDGRLLVALLPVARLRNSNHWLGVYSLEWPRLGQCLHTAVLEHSAVSVALSPTARHLAVGLGSRRFTSTPHARNNVFALLYRLEPLEGTSRTGLSPIKELEQNWERGFMSLNCLRWAPQPGQGLVYANNTGQLIIMS